MYCISVMEKHIFLAAITPVLCVTSWSFRNHLLYFCWKRKKLW